jgi:hypothetical protein
MAEHNKGRRCFAKRPINHEEHTMNRTGRWLKFLMAAGTILTAGPMARAVPYASGVHNTGGATWEFILNEAADNVTVLRDGGSALNLGARPAGRHTFDMTGFTAYDIEVSKSAPVGWTTISDVANPFTNYTIPSGLAINTDPASQYFGTVYVANANPATTERGRTMGDGIYSLTSDMIGVDLTSNFAAVANANDAGLAKAPGFTTNGSASASPWRLTLDAAGNVIISDWSDPGGGLKYASPTLATGGLILDGDGDMANPTVHGSIAAKTYVTGSVGNNLTVYAMDEDALPSNTIWRWDVGNATNYAQPPSATVIDSGALDGISSWISTVVGVRAGAHYSPEHDLWYMVQNRNDGNEAGIFVVKADGVDGFTPTLLWDSFTFTSDPNGDFDPADALDGHNGLDFSQDVFRNIGDVTLSPDGTKLLVQRIATPGATNPHSPAAVAVIPLDENGVPDIEVSGGMMTNVAFITTIGSELAHSSGAQLEFDAAGNLYVANSGFISGNPNGTAQLVQVLSPGGNTKATTSSGGTFEVEPFTPPANNADFDNDGDVDGDDFLTWQRGLGLTGQTGKSTGDADGDGDVDGTDLAEWISHFGMPPAAGAAGAVPEPGAVVLLAIGLVGVNSVRRRRGCRGRASEAT